jgi:hypothetical protein
MPPVSIPLSIAAALPIVGQMLSSVLTDDRQKPGINALIAGFFLLAVAALCMVLAGNFTGNWIVGIGIIIAYCALLMRGSLGMLMQFFELTPSPIANVIFGKQPTAVAPPTAGQLIAQRASTPAPASMTARPVQPPRTTGG